MYDEERKDEVGQSDVERLRRYERCITRLMDAYHYGLTARLATFAAKKNKSHRYVPNDVVKHLDELCENKAYVTAEVEATEEQIRFINAKKEEWMRIERVILERKLLACLL